MSTNDPLLDQLLHDETFFRWVHRTDPVAVARWEVWLAQHLEHQMVVEEAARMVQGIPFAPQKLSEDHRHRAWLDLQIRLAIAERSSTRSPKPRRNRRRWFRAAAAVTFGALLTTLAWWLVQPAAEQFIYATSYGETRTVRLPDGSKVTLNANSQVTYQAPTESTLRREVWLKGEAFFAVVHRRSAAPLPFVVHTPDLQVQVLGTQFNVNTRRGRTQVVLDEGSVELQLPSEEKATMQPGELAEYSEEAAGVHKENVDPELFTAWRDRRLKFDDTPLSEVALVLEENYGVRVVFDDSALRAKRVTGEVSASELKTILLALSKLFDISVQQSGDTIRIARHYVSP